MSSESEVDEVVGEDNIQEEDSETEASVVQDSEDFPHEEGYTDVALVVENKRIHLNKGFLMSASPVFKAMFLGQFKEKNSTEIPLPDKKYTEVVLFFTFLQQNEEIKFSDDNVIPVMYLAWEYQTMQLVQRCEEYFMLVHFQSEETKASTEFLMEIYKIGEISKRTTLVTTTLKYLVKRAYGEMKTKGIYKDLPLDLRLKLLENRLNALEVHYKENHRSSSDCSEIFQNNSITYVGNHFPRKGYSSPCSYHSKRWKQGKI